MADETAVYETGTMGFDVKLRGPGSVEVYDRKAGKVGATLEDAVENTIYRATLPELHDKLVPRIQEFTGMTREVNATATEAARGRSKNPDKVKDIMETVPKFVKRATAGFDKDRMAELQRIVQEVADTIEIDPSPSKRATGIPKEYLAKADSVLTLDTDELEAKVTSWLEKVPGYEVERDEDNKPTRESLARLAQEVVKTLL
jgi:protein-tyrosine-phosphatase